MKFTFWFFLLLFASNGLLGCAPVPVRGHQASPQHLPENFSIPKTRCEGFLSNFGSTVYELEHPTKRFRVFLSEEGHSDPIEVVVSFSSQAGDSYFVESGKIRFRYEYNDWMITEGQLTSVQDYEYEKLFHRKDLPQPLPEAKSVSQAIGWEHSFQISDYYTRNWIQIRAKIPFYRQDFEVEIPKIKINGEEFAPRIFKFKWNNRWTTSPLNGC